MDAHRVYLLKSYELPMGIPCTPLVHGAEAGDRRGACMGRKLGIQGWGGTGWWV